MSSDMTGQKAAIRAAFVLLASIDALRAASVFETGFACPRPDLRANSCCAWLRRCAAYLILY